MLKISRLERFASKVFKASFNWNRRKIVRTVEKPVSDGVIIKHNRQLKLPFKEKALK